jgi:hypothetical protein
MKTRRESKGRKRIRQGRREKEIQIDYLQREIARERGLSVTHAASERSISKSIPRSFPHRPLPTRVSPPIPEKKPENRVMEWIRECEKPVILDLMDDVPRPKTSGYSPPFKMND